MDYAALGACSPPPLAGQDPLAGCSFFDMVPGSQAVITLTFTMAATGDYSVLGTVIAEGDTDPSNDAATGCITVVSILSLVSFFVE